ncbi:MAG: BrnT family toxin [Deltaproteobacteria bacterium]|nr:BrnT family toxin [Deltaproteobacteria bacterium]
MNIEWDPRKAKSNVNKHGVSFEEAATALSDPLAATGADPDHSITEDKFVTFGVSKVGQLLVVSHIEERETIRIISVRKATKGERKLYEEE